MELKTCKILVLVLLGAIKLVSGLTPMLITKILRKKSRRCLNRLIGVVLCLGGGVLLATVFLHILPEVRETLERSSAVGLLELREEYPVAELVLCLGFLAIFLIETVVCKLFGLGHSHSHGHGFGGDSEMSVSVNNSKNNTQAGRPDDPMVSMVHSHNETTQPIRSMPFIGATQFESDRNVYNVSSATLVFSTSFSDLTQDTISCPPTSPSKYLRRSKFVSSMRTFLVVLALSIHSVFEGMAIGLQENERGVWKLFIAVAVHATAILFCIGMEMISTGMRKLQIAFYVAVLAAVTPIGVAIGIMVSLDVDQSGEGDVLVVGILQGVAGGTLLYITFFEVLDREKLAKYKMSGLVGIVAILLGFGAMASLEGFGGHSHLQGGHGHAHIDEGHRFDHLNGDHGHVHGFDQMDGGHGQVHIDEGHGFDHLNGGHEHVHRFDQMDGGRRHGHMDEGNGDLGHIHIVGEQGHVGGGHGNDHNMGDHRFDPVKEDQGNAHTKDRHGDAHSKDTTNKDQHGDAVVQDIHGNAPTSTEARGHEQHGDFDFDKASEREHNVSLKQHDLMPDSKTLGHVHSVNEALQHEHDASQIAIHQHIDNIKDGDALNHTHHVDQDVELKHNDHLETGGQVHSHSDSFGLSQIHIKENQNEVEHKHDHGVLVKDSVRKNNSEIKKDNVEQKEKQDGHSDRLDSLNQVLNKEKNDGNKSELPDFHGKLSDESMENSDSNPSDTKQVDDQETMRNDTTNIDDGKHDHEVISNEDHFIVRDKEGGLGNDSRHTEDNNVLSSLVELVHNSNQTKSETGTKGHNADSDDSDFKTDKSQTVVLIDEDTIIDVHREDTLIIDGENENSASKSNSSENHVSYDDDKIKYNQTSNYSDKNHMVHQEVFSNSKASMNDNTLEEGNVKLSNSEIVDDLNDNFEEVPILNNTSEVFFDYNEIVDNVEVVKSEGDSPPLELMKDLDNDKNATTLVNDDIVFFEESTDDKASKNSTKDNVKHDTNINKHDLGIDKPDVIKDEQDIENENNIIDSVKTQSDEPKPWWTAFF